MIVALYKESKIRCLNAGFIIQRISKPLLLKNTVLLQGIQRSLVDGHYLSFLRGGMRCVSETFVTVCQTTCHVSQDRILK
jgi:hypothetical protein